MTFARLPRDDATAASVDATTTPWWVVGAGALLLALGFGRKPMTVAPRSRERRRTGTLRDTRTRAREPRGREADDRGRSATTPSEIPARGWKDILVRTYGELGEDRVVAIAAGVTFYVLLAIFPTVAALVSLYGLFADPQTIGTHLKDVSAVLPGGAVDIIGDQINSLVAQGGKTLGLTFFTGLAISLWSANAGIKALIDALNVVYGEKEKRGFFKLNVLSLTFTVGIIAFMLLAMGAMVALPIALDQVGLGRLTEVLIKLARWPVMFLAAALVIALLYRYGPSRDTAKWRWVSWGSALAAIVWIVASILFSWYAANFGSYNKTYGSLGAAIGFMTWIWISTIVILVGAELDAEMEHQTARDTTEGKPRPLGARGARMADTIGEAAG